MSEEMLKSYIDGAWTLPKSSSEVFEAINPATEEVAARIAMCGADDVDLAVAAANRAFASWGFTTLDHRIALVEKLITIFERRYDEMVSAISTEMGAPYDLSYDAQAECGPGHLKETITAARAMEWERRIGSTGKLVHEPIGVCVLITPWNWPINQLAAKIGPALVAGCTMVLKPSEISPLSAQLFAEFIDEAGFPAGVFNMVHGSGAAIGDALTGHPDVDMVSFTGSTRAGIQIAKSAAATIKRVAQELGGKSANIVFADKALEAAVTRGVIDCFSNTGQSCNAPTRMLVEASAYNEAVKYAAAAAATVALGDPMEKGPHLGPVVSKAHYDKIQRLIQIGIDEGATLIAGGTGKPEGFETGYYVKPTVFANVENAMTIAQEEVFGPVTRRADGAGLSHHDLEAIELPALGSARQLARGTRQQLRGHRSAHRGAPPRSESARSSPGHARRVGRRIRAHADRGGKQRARASSVRLHPSKKLSVPNQTYLY